MYFSAIKFRLLNIELRQLFDRNVAAGQISKRIEMAVRYQMDAIKLNDYLFVLRTSIKHISKTDFVWILRKFSMGLWLFNVW